MAEDYTDEQRIEALKAWWAEYGKQTALSVALVVSGYFGWEYLGYRQSESAQVASEQFSELLDLFPQELGGQFDQPVGDELSKVADSLKENDSGSGYGYLATLINSRAAIEQENLNDASSDLRWLLEQKLSEVDERLVRLRLARVEAERGYLDDALALVQGVDPGAFESLYNEAIGDFFYEKGNYSAAYTAYQAAIESLQSGDNVTNRLLEMKLGLASLDASRGIVKKMVPEFSELEKSK